MPQPHVEVLGVYRLAVTNKLLKQQFDILYGYEMSDAQKRQAKRQCKQQLESVVLIEVLVENHDHRFQLTDFTQSQEGVSRDSWQVAWAEAYLTVNGKSLLVERWGDEPPDRSFRCAFFLHFYQPDKQLITSYGELNCPPVEEMPERLKQLVPFTPVD